MCVCVVCVSIGGSNVSSSGGAGGGGVDGHVGRGANVGGGGGKGRTIVKCEESVFFKTKTKFINNFFLVLKEYVLKLS